MWVWGCVKAPAGENWCVLPVSERLEVCGIAPATVSADFRESASLAMCQVPHDIPQALHKLDMHKEATVPLLSSTPKHHPSPPRRLGLRASWK